MGCNENVCFDVTRAGRPFVWRHLRDGLTLGRLVVGLVERSKGRVVTCQPRDTDPQRLTQLEYGGIDQDAAWDWLVDTIAAHMSADERHITVFENYHARPFYPYVTRFTSRVVVYGEEMYHVLTQSGFGFTQIEPATRDASSRHQVVHLTSAPPRFGPRSRSFCLRDLDNMARHTRRIIVGAYDEEGFVMWQPAGG